jgi:hypothetical protein
VGVFVLSRAVGVTVTTVGTKSDTVVGEGVGRTYDGSFDGSSDCDGTGEGLYEGILEGD